MTQPPLTPDDLARIEELAEKATPGPWEVAYDTAHGEGHFVFAQNGDYYVADTSETTSMDAEFIAAARTAVPALVAGVRSLQARITELETEKAAAWWEGVNDQWKHRPVGNRVGETQNPHGKAAQ